MTFDVTFLWLAALVQRSDRAVTGTLALRQEF